MKCCINVNLRDQRENKDLKTYTERLRERRGDRVKGRKGD
jgi:hypothetical protein